jgi:hypothetical protein
VQGPVCRGPAAWSGGTLRAGVQCLLARMLCVCVCVTPVARSDAVDVPELGPNHDMIRRLAEAEGKARRSLMHRCVPGHLLATHDLYCLVKQPVC